MIFKYLIIAFIILVVITSSGSYMSGYYFNHEMDLERDAFSNVKEMPWMSPELFRPYLEDHEDRVSDSFKVTPYYYNSVNFWFMIYTQFEASSVVIHDKSNLSLIYKVLDFSSLHKKKLSKNTVYELQKKLADEKIKAIRADLNELVKNPFSVSAQSTRIYETLKKAKIQIPISKDERITFFKKLSKNLRGQTGQKNFIRDGLARSLPYRAFLQKYFTEKKLPVELLAIPFLESSFNPLAHSKVNALGPWQFMPFIAAHFLPKRSKDFDYRRNIGVSSLGAAFLMEENFRIMKSWDLAVTAYNSGTKHLLRTKRELASDTIDLEAVIRHSDSEHFGFASKNFYSEFLALAHTLAYKEELFEHLHDLDRSDVDEDLRFYVTKCPLELKKVLSDDLNDDVIFHNHHLPATLKRLPKGFILTTKGALPEKQFFQIPFEEMLKLKPRDWERLLKRQSCSTR